MFEKLRLVKLEAIDSLAIAKIKIDEEVEKFETAVFYVEYNIN